MNPNEQQPEIEHKMKCKNSTSDYSSEAGRGWRESMDDGYFSYEMSVDSDEQNYLAVTYWGSDKECFIDGKRYIREFNIYVDGTLILQETLNENKPYALFDKFYVIPKEFTNGKGKIEVKFTSSDEKIAGRIFGIRIVSKNEL